MGALERITISLPSEMLVEIKAVAEAGEFTNPSEVIHDALRQWRRSRKSSAGNDVELRQLVMEGRDSGAPLDGEVTLQRLRKKYAKMAV